MELFRSFSCQQEVQFAPDRSRASRFLDRLAKCTQCLRPSSGKRTSQIIIKAETSEQALHAEKEAEAPHASWWSGDGNQAYVVSPQQWARSASDSEEEELAPLPLRPGERPAEAPAVEEAAAAQAGGSSSSSPKPRKAKLKVKPKSEELLEIGSESEPSGASPAAPTEAAGASPLSFTRPPENEAPAAASLDAEEAAATGSSKKTSAKSTVKRVKPKSKGTALPAEGDPLAASEPLQGVEEVPTGAAAKDGRVKVKSKGKAKLRASTQLSQS